MNVLENEGCMRSGLVFIGIHLPSLSYFETTLITSLPYNHKEEKGGKTKENLFP